MNLNSDDEISKFLDWAKKRHENTDHLISNLIDDLSHDKDDRILSNSISVLMMALDRIVGRMAKTYPHAKEELIKGLEVSMLKMIKSWREDEG